MQGLSGDFTTMPLKDVVQYLGNRRLSGKLLIQRGGVFKELTLSEGSVVSASASLWHRAMAPKPGATKRRLVIFGFSPTWMKQVDKPSAGAGKGLTDKLVGPGATTEMRELLGLSGFF